MANRTVEFLWTEATKFLMRNRSNIIEIMLKRWEGERHIKKEKEKGGKNFRKMKEKDRERELNIVKVRESEKMCEN